MVSIDTFCQQKNQAEMVAAFFVQRPAPAPPSVAPACIRRGRDYGVRNQHFRLHALRLTFCWIEEWGIRDWSIKFLFTDTPEKGCIYALHLIQGVFFCQALIAPSVSRFFSKTSVAFWDLPIRIGHTKRPFRFENRILDLVTEILLTPTKLA